MSGDDNLVGKQSADFVICPRCRHRFSSNLVHSGDNDRQTLVAANDAVLLSREFAVDLSKKMAGLNISRRSLPNWIADQIFNFDGNIMLPSGGILPITDDLIDNAFGEDESHRWISNFLLFHRFPPKRKLQEKLLQRMRLLDIAFRIHQVG